MASTRFDPRSFAWVPREDVLEALRSIWSGLGRPGRRWTGVERVAVARAVRAAAPRPPWDPRPSPADLDTRPAPGSVLSPLVVDTVERMAVESPGVRRGWFDEVAAGIGFAGYAELLGVVAQVVTADRLCAVLGRELEPLPAPQAGAVRADPMPDLDPSIAWLPLPDPWPGPNITRALGASPEDNRRWFGAVSAMYTADLLTMVWDDRPLSRPQGELLAARTSALNECFY